VRGSDALSKLHELIEAMATFFMGLHKALLEEFEGDDGSSGRCIVERGFRVVHKSLIEFHTTGARMMDWDIDSESMVATERGSAEILRGKGTEHWFGSVVGLPTRGLDPG
jgi:hypothetical protein